MSDMDQNRDFTPRDSSGEDRPPRRDFGDRPSFGDRPPRRDFGDRPSFGDRPPRRDFGDRPSFGDRPPRRDGDRPSFGNRPPRRDGDRPSFGDRPPRRDGDRPSFGDRPPRRDGDRPSFGDRPPRRDGDRPSFGDRPPRRDGDRPSFGDRPPRRDGDRPSFGDRPPRRDGDRPSFGDRAPRPSFADDAFFENAPRRPFGDRPSYGDRPPRRDGDRPSFGNKGRSQEELPAFLRKVEALKNEKGREREGAFLIEGVRCVAEVLSFSPEVIEKVYYVEGFDNKSLLADIEKKQIKCEALPQHQFDALSSTQNSQGILAVGKPAPIKPNWETANIVTLVDGVQDPGNLGSIFRSCLGFGVDALVLGKGTCDPFNPKVVRGSSGTFLRVPFEQYVDLDKKIIDLLSRGYSVVATTPHAVQSITDIKLRKKVAFLIGNEGNGANARYIDMCTEQVKIPMNSDLESLNVAVAHGILAFELNKMRGEA